MEQLHHHIGGATPFVAASGGGAVNRIIEIRCSEKLFEDPAGLCKVIKANYGHAGKRFIELISDPVMMENARQVQALFYKEINKNSTEKQALAASLILTADFLINEYIFKDGRCISFGGYRSFLSDKDEVCQEKPGPTSGCRAGSSRIGAVSFQRGMPM